MFVVRVIRNLWSTLCRKN